MRSSWFVLGLMALAVGSADAQQTRSILFIGNSFTFGSGSAVRFWRANTVTDLNEEGIGGVPALFKSFTDQTGLPYDVHLETRGGSAFDFHLSEKLTEITSQAWDVVVAHSYSTLDRENPNDPTALLATGRELSDVLHRRSPAVEFYVTATWSRPDLTYPEGTPCEDRDLGVADEPLLEQAGDEALQLGSREARHGKSPEQGQRDGAVVGDAHGLVQLFEVEHGDLEQVLPPDLVARSAGQEDRLRRRQVHGIRLEDLRRLGRGLGRSLKLGDLLGVGIVVLGPRRERAHDQDR